MRRGEIWWASVPEPASSEPSYRRPVLIVQADAFNRSALSTVIVVALTTNLHLAQAPGNVALTKRQSSLPKASVVNVSQILTLDRSFLTERVGRLPISKLRDVERGLARVLDIGQVDGI